MILLDSVHKSYISKMSVNPIDLKILTNVITVLIDPNGTGKSTLLTMTGRLLTADPGDINVGPYNVDKTRLEDLAKVLSVLRQDNHFVMRLIVRQLVSLGHFPYSQERLTTEDKCIISQYIEFLNLEALQSRYLDELSGGQRQRVYVVMVLRQGMDYVLLDEPSNNLGISHSVDIMSYLYTTVCELGRTMVAVLHNISSAARYAGYICAAKDDQITEHGPTTELMRSEILSLIFNIQIGIVQGPHGPVTCRGS